MSRLTFLGCGELRYPAQRPRAPTGRDPAPPRRRPIGGPRHPVVVGARADPRVDDVEPSPARARGACEVTAGEFAPAVRINAIAPGRVATPASPSSTLAAPHRAGYPSRRFSDRRSSGFRSDGTAIRPRSVGAGRSCSRPRPRTSRGRSSVRAAWERRHVGGRTTGQPASPFPGLQGPHLRTLTRPRPDDAPPAADPGGHISGRTSTASVGVRIRPGTGGSPAARGCHRSPGRR